MMPVEAHWLLWKRAKPCPALADSDCAVCLHEVLGLGFRPRGQTAQAPDLCDADAVGGGLRRVRGVWRAFALPRVGKLAPSTKILARNLSPVETSQLATSLTRFATFEQGQHKLYRCAASMWMENHRGRGALATFNNWACIFRATMILFATLLPVASPGPWCAAWVLPVKHHGSRCPPHTIMKGVASPIVVSRTSPCMFSPALHEGLIRDSPVPTRRMEAYAVGTRLTRADGPLTIAAAVQTKAVRETQTGGVCPSCYAPVPDNCVVCPSCGDLIMLGGSRVRTPAMAQSAWLAGAPRSTTA